MGYGLPEGVHFAMVGERAIFLDLAGDRYFCLGERANTAFARLLSGSALSAQDADVLDDIAARSGLVVTDDFSVPSPAVLSSACGALPPDRPVRTSAVTRALFALLLTALRLRFSPLCSVMGGLRARKQVLQARSSAVSLEAVLEIAASFEKARRLIDLRDSCLLHSVAVQRALDRQGAASTLVLGVMLRPFAAHCWVEYAGFVLNDDPDHVRSFTPIFAI